MLEPATQAEIDATVAVMGGEDWQMWIDALLEAGVLAEGATTTAFTYLGEKITHDIYWNGSIGAAKKDLDQKVLDIRAKLAARGQLGADVQHLLVQVFLGGADRAVPIDVVRDLFAQVREGGRRGAFGQDAGFQQRVDPHLPVFTAHDRDGGVDFGLGGRFQHRFLDDFAVRIQACLLYTSPSPRD